MGLWGICDDNYATFPNKPGWIKAQIFPYESVSADTLLQELDKIGKIIPFISEGKKFWFLKNFHKYQRVDKPSKPKYPQFSSSTPVLFTEHSPNTPAEEKRREEKRSKDTRESADAPSPDVKKFIDFFFRATQAIRRIKPEIAGGKDDKLVKEKLKKYSLDQLERLTLWFLSDHKMTRNHQTGEPFSSYRFAPAISFMMSSSVFNELLSAEKNEIEFLKRISQYTPLVYPSNEHISAIKGQGLKRFAA